MTSPAPTAEQILATAMPDNPNGAETIGAYLGDLLHKLWAEGDDFSSKRPFGMSDWQWIVYTALVKAGHLRGKLDEDGYLDDVDHRAADDLVQAAIAHLVARP